MSRQYFIGLTQRGPAPSYRMNDVSPWPSLACDQATGAGRAVIGPAASASVATRCREVSYMVSRPTRWCRLVLTNARNAPFGDQLGRAMLELGADLVICVLWLPSAFMIHRLLRSR